jgi:DNA-binding MarR family transcriptional regulator
MEIEDKMKEPLRSELADDAIQAYLELGDAIRLASLPSWITADLTTSQVKAVILLEHHGPLPVGKLAEWLGIGNPAASIIVQQLVEQGLAERSEDSFDRRRTLVSLTAQGTQLISGQREQREGSLRRWLSQLGDEELTALRDGLRALVGIVRSEQAEARA